MEVVVRHEVVRRWMLAGAALLLATVGCMMGQTTQVHWDLRHSHTKKDVQWTNAQTAQEVAHVDVTLLLPPDRSFIGQDVTVRMSAQGEQVQILSVFYVPTSLDDGYQHAKRLAHDWQLDATSLDAWYQEVQSGRKQGVRDRDAHFPVALTGKPLGPGGPTPYARIVYSFDEQNPALLDFELQWVPGA
jgi:hypothetical protein